MTDGRVFAVLMGYFVAVFTLVAILADAGLGALAFLGALTLTAICLWKSDPRSP